jgi:hypothetical protein
MSSSSNGCPLTILLSDTKWPFEYRISPVFGCSLYYEIKNDCEIIEIFENNSKKLIHKLDLTIL